MKILLISPPVREEVKPAIFPVGLGYIAAVLLKENHEVNVLDIDGNRYSEEIVKNKIKEYIDSGINTILTGGIITTFNYLEWMNAYIKEISPNSILIGGNSVVSAIPKIALEKLKFDYGVIQEGEITICELIKSIEKRNILQKRYEIDGICFKEKDEIIITKPRKLINNLDEIPFPAWHLFNIEEYIKNPAAGSGTRRKINISTNRGCPFACEYCYKIWGMTYRYRSIKSILSEMDYLSKNYKINYFILGDDNFTINKERVNDFCDLLIKKKRKYGFSISSRINGLDFVTLKKLKSVGCNFIGVGIESASQKILNNMKKGIKVSEIEEGIKRIRKAGLEPYASFMTNYLGEDKETIRESVVFMKRMVLPGTFWITRAYPGTPLYKYCLDNKLITNEYLYIKSLLSDCKVDRLTINFSDLSNSELMEEKYKAERELRFYLPNIFNKFVRYFRSNGWYAFSFANLRWYFLRALRLVFK